MDTVSDMVKQTKQPLRVAVRFTGEDQKLATALGKKLGVSISSIVRLALRALATKEGVTA